MRKLMFVKVAVALPLLLVLAGDLRAETASVLLQQGVYAEETEGDIKKAIGIYRKLLGEERSLRALAAQAQFRLAMCLQKEGLKQEAVTAFRELVDRFAEEKELQYRARKELAGLGAASPEIKARKILIPGEPAYQNISETRLGSVSPEGTHFSFTDWRTPGANRLRVRDLGTGEIVDITPTESSLNPGNSANALGGSVWNSVFSPDGRSIAFASIGTNFGLWVAGLDGSEPRRLWGGNRSNTNDHSRWIQPVYDWSPNGKEILALNGNNLISISVSGGSGKVIKQFEHAPDGADFLQSSARFSPDGRYIAFEYAPDKNAPFQREIFTIAVDGGSETMVTRHPAHDYGPVWTPDGKALVFASNRTGAAGLWLVPIESGRPAGEPTLIYQTMGRLVPKGFTRHGLYYFELNLGEHDLYVVEVNPDTGKPAADPVRLSVPHEGWNTAACWSPDGERIAFLSRPNFTRIALDGISKPILCVHSRKSGETREFTLPPELEFLYNPGPGWTPDGSALLFAGRKGERNGFYRLDLNTGKPALIFEVAADVYLKQAVWTADGAALIYNRTLGNTNAIVLHDLKLGKERDLWRGGRWLTLGTLSPDAKRLVFAQVLHASDCGGGPPLQNVIKILNLETAALDRTITLPSDEHLQGPLEWSRDGKHILFARGKVGAQDPVLCRVSIDGGEAQELGVSTLRFGGSFSRHPDGTKIVFTGPGRGAELWALEGLDISATRSQRASLGSGSLRVANQAAK